MKKTTAALLLPLICLSCIWAKEKKETGSTPRHGPGNCPSDSSLTAFSWFKPLAGVDVNNVIRKKDTIETGDSSIAFKIYFSASACRDVRYTLHAKGDTLVVLQNLDGDCYRHGTGYGVAGGITKICPGKYTLVVARGKPHARDVDFFLQEIIVGQKKVFEIPNRSDQVLELLEKVEKAKP